VVPIRIDMTLPDAIVKAETFDKAMKCTWEVNDHFRMFFADKRANARVGALLSPLFQTCFIFQLEPRFQFF
jgi:hypothetical protein